MVGGVNSPLSSMRLIDRYMLKLVAWPMVGCLGVTVVALLLERILRLLDALSQSSARFGYVTELAANLFRATQTEEKLRRDGVRGKQKANQTHFEVGRKVRQTIDELGGTMPENLPKPESSIQQIESAQKKLAKTKAEK